MKTKIAILLLSILLSGCIKDVLDRKPLDRVFDADVWKSPELIDLYLVPLYDNIPIGHTRGNVYESNLTDEASHPYAGVTIVNNYGNYALILNTGMYSWIRKANYFLEMIGTSSLSETQIKELRAECRFIRAYYYFDLVKKYGGMPIITIVQSINNDPEELRVSRNTEEEVYEFLLKELDESTVDLPEVRTGNNRNRATKYTAQALKARAMLYAGSIAKYGSVQLDGLVGIPSEKAKKYFTDSYNAAKFIIDGKYFSLYDKLYDPIAKTGDPVANFEAIFLVKDNQEVIFQKAYSADKVHSYDTYNLPDSFKPGCCGNSQSPILSMVESYENIDGSDGKLDVVNMEYDTPDELFKNKDPRFAATILRSESPFIGRNVQIYRGIYDQNNVLYETRNTPFTPDPSVIQVGRDGPYTLGDVGKTGFYLKKYLNPTGGIVPESRSIQNYIDFRYAEILLTFAEAIFEADNDKTAALAAINEVRNRAGIKLLSLSELTRDRIRHERKVELAFEDKRFWDIRRYRIGTDLFKNTYVQGLWPYLKYNGSTYKYTYKVVSGAPIDNGQPRVFQERDYYSNLSGYISSNDKIINNPGW